MESEAATPVSSFLKSAPEAEVLVLDVFSAQPQQQPWHGDLVASILESGGVESEKILKLDNRNDETTNALLSDLGWQVGPEPMEERVEAYIELSATHLLMKTNGKLRGILESPNHQLKVVNQSQGKSRVDIYALLADNIFDTNNLGPNNEQIPSALGENLAKVLGVSRDVPALWGREMKQKLIDRVDQVVDESALVADVQQQHSELLSELGSRGVVVVTSAGNNADELTSLRDQGFQVPDDFDDDLTAVGEKIVVGAIDRGASPGADDDKVAFFSSRYEGVNAYANGVNVPAGSGQATGTSYAAPKVAASAYHLLEQRPDWSTEQVHEAIQSEFRFSAE